ncbi:hypothetical protein LR48_Vigan07g173800 [Vigna angularis]|uniref:Putative plant transposon protein domain-containing protein n=1 Tax=Phaseolus angularis TaxID=3914 RepID=A0A0L9UZT2_PHAAN|nr:hypothetical protein LR48_Vigan07g173800 [Vigna angularis]
MISSSGKRIKTLGSKENGTKRKEKEQFHSDKFRTPANKRYFPQVEGRKLLMETKVTSIPSLATQFERELNNRDWGHLEVYSCPANVDIVKEFYTNAKALRGEEDTYFSYVRGKRIIFYADAINYFLGIEWEEEQCQFALSMLEGVDYEEVERTLSVPRGNFQRTQPCSHVSDITVPRAIILYCILKGLNIDIGQVIAEELQICVRGATSKAPLGHPSLITHLCGAAGIDVSRPPLERPRKELDASYFTHYCAVDEPGHLEPPPQQPTQHRRAPPPPRSQGEQALLRTLMSAFPKRQLMSQDEFAAYVAWPADPPQKGDRAEAAEASAMDEGAEVENSDEE